MQTIIFFDIDSTLVENQFGREALDVLIREIADATGRDIRHLGHELWRENKRRQDEDPDHPLTMDWDDILETIAARYDVTLSQRGIDLWRAYADPEKVIINDDAPSVLETLKAQGHRLIIATKGLSKYQIPVLEVTKLLPYFEDILAPDVTGYLKTTPEYFHKYAPDESTLFIQVGDHYVDDVICPKRNGFYSILRAPIEALRHYDAFERPYHLAGNTEAIPTFPEMGSGIRPDAIVMSLQEVPDLVRRIREKHNT